LEGTDVSRIEYRIALALIAPVLVPCMLSAQPSAPSHNSAATAGPLSSITADAQQQPPATQPPQQTQPPASQPPQQTQPPATQPPQPPTGVPPAQPTTGTQPTQPPTAMPPAQPPTGTQPTPPTGTQPTQPPTGTQPTQPTTGAQPTQPPTGTQPAQPTAGAPLAQPTSGAVDSEGSGALLDRMQAILDAALGNRPADQPVGTSGVLPGVDTKSKAGKISVDRAALDEVLAEVQQLRTMLRVRQ
jgi:outer membrane biosynthesis protein TonB